MIEFKPGCYYYRLWFASNHHDQDWFCAVWKDEQGKIQLRYRFRYYKPGSDEESHDNKNWYGGTGKPDAKVEDLIEGCQMIADVCRLRMGHLDTIIVDGDDKRAFELLSQREWAHIKKEKVQ